MTEKDNKIEDIFGWGCLALFLLPGLIFMVFSIVRSIENNDPLFTTFWIGLKGLPIAFHIHPGIIGMLLIGGLIYGTNFLIKKFFGPEAVQKFGNIILMIVGL